MKNRYKICFLILGVVLSSCGGSFSSFNKQKYTNLRKIKTSYSNESIIGESVSEEVKDNSSEDELMEPVLITKLEEKKDIEIYETVQDSLNVPNYFAYASEIKRGIRIKAKFYIEVDSTVYLLDNVSFEDATGRTNATVVSMNHKYFELSDQIIKVNKFDVLENNKISFEHEDIISYKEGDRIIPVDEEPMSYQDQSGNVSQKPTSSKSSSRDHPGYIWGGLMMIFIGVVLIILLALLGVTIGSVIGLLIYAIPGVLTIAGIALLIAGLYS